MRTYGFSPRHVSHRIGNSVCSQPARLSVLASRALMISLFSLLGQGEGHNKTAAGEEKGGGRRDREKKRRREEKKRRKDQGAKQTTKRQKGKSEGSVSFDKWGQYVQFRQTTQITTFEGIGNTGKERQTPKNRANQFCLLCCCLVFLCLTLRTPLSVHKHVSKKGTSKVGRGG